MARRLKTTSTDNPTLSGTGSMLLVQCLLLSNETKLPLVDVQLCFLVFKMK